MLQKLLFRKFFVVAYLLFVGGFGLWLVLKDGVAIYNFGVVVAFASVLGVLRSNMLSCKIAMFFVGMLMLPVIFEIPTVVIQNGLTLKLFLAMIPVTVVFVIIPVISIVFLKQIIKAENKTISD